MLKTQLAEVFERMALLLELKGADPFRIRSMRTAASAVLEYPGSADEFFAALSRNEVRGFGPHLTSTALSLRQTGRAELLDELEAEFSPEFLELLQVDGLGVKKLLALRNGLGVRNLDTLREACLNNSVAQLKGFGIKSQERLLAALETRLAYRGRMRLDTAWRLAEEVLSCLLTACSKAEATGALRRSCPVLDAVDILVCGDRREVSRLMAEKHWKERPSSRGPSASQTYSSTRGRTVNIHFAAEDEFVVEQMLSTGSMDHLRLLEEHGRTGGMAQGFQGASGPFASEHEIYALLDLAYIAPEAREGTFEVERAAQARARGDNALRLVQLDDIKGILHVHTTYSDGVDSLRDVALAVKQMGYEYLGVTEHSASASYAGGLLPDAVKKQREEVCLLNAELAPFQIFHGIECEILPDGRLDYTDEVRRSFDFLIASVHSAQNADEEAITKRICTALADPSVTILGHPSGRLLLRREAHNANLLEVLDAAAEHGVAVEVNANPRRLDLQWEFHQAAVRLGVPLAVCPDAHSIGGIDDLRWGIAAARKGMLTPEDVLTCRNAASLSQFFNSRKRRRPG